MSYARAKLPKPEMMQFKKSEIKELAFHLRTVGAFVQTPVPSVVGLKNDEVIGSVDAKSLYPTAMCNGNIGYDSLFGRVYDDSIVGPVLKFIRMIKAKMKTNPKSILDGYMHFKKNLLQQVTAYISRNKVAKNNKQVKELTSEYYSQLFYVILAYPGEIESIMRPQTDQEYQLLKSALIPLFEAVTWMHVDNKGYNNTICSYLFENQSFVEKYKNRTFIVVDNINRSFAGVRELDCKTFIEYYATKFNLNPYGTLFYRHYDLKSFEVDNIFSGMASRKTIKDQGLILGAVVGAWDKLEEKDRMNFYDTDNFITEDVVTNVLDIIGDSNPKKKLAQAKSLLGLELGINEKVSKQRELTGKDLSKLIKDELDLIASQKMARQNGEKTSLNTGYGLYAMVTWDYFQPLVSNSITSAGKIVGIKLFQQIAVNILKNEYKGWR